MSKKAQTNNPNNETSNSTSEEKLTCPICGKVFNFNDDTRYIIAGGYTCSWKCFLNESKRRESLRREQQQEKKSKQKV